MPSTICRYVSDPPKAKNRTGVLTGNQCCRNYHYCLLSTTIFMEIFNENKWCLRASRGCLAKYKALKDEPARLESLEMKEDAAIRKARAFSLLRDNSYKPYEPVPSVISSSRPSSAHGALLPVIDLFKCLGLNPCPISVLVLRKWLLWLSAVLVYSALPRGGKTLNQMIYFLYEADTFYQSDDMKLDFNELGKD